jgi:hypothetical protein
MVVVGGGDVCLRGGRGGAAAEARRGCIFTASASGQQLLRLVDHQWLRSGCRDCGMLLALMQSCGATRQVEGKVWHALCLTAAM